MHVVATAGHVDHGKSTLVRALTGMEPDRFEEERRRGMTIDLGFAWTTLPGGEQVAFVDVPGHERFVTTTLAGVGPAPALLLVVAADEGWMPQTEEHLAAVTALGARHLLLVVTKCDVAAPDAAVAEARERLSEFGDDGVPAVAVSAATGSGMSELRDAIGRLVATLPAPVADAPVRLWVDRAFTIRGAGTVVTGTLTAGTLHVGDELVLLPADRHVVVRGLQSLGERHDEVAPPARVAVNLRGVDRDDLRRGDALVTPDAWASIVELDVLVAGDDLPQDVVAHVGSAAVTARLRRLAPGALRVRLATPMPLHLGDRLLLRDPASRRLAGGLVADLRPPPIRRRGDALRIGAALAVPADADAEVARRGTSDVGDIRRQGLSPATVTSRRIGRHLLSPAVWEAKRAELAAVYAADEDAADGVPVTTLRRRLDLPDDALLLALVAEVPDVVVTEGRVRPARAVAEVPRLEPVLSRLAAEPFAAPDATELAELQVTRVELARAVSAGLLVRLADGLYVGPHAPERAVEVLRGLPQPFTVSEARQALGSTRRVVVPLLEHLDAARLTRRLSDGTRSVVKRPT